MSAPVVVSCIVPVRNEAKTLPELHARFRRAMQRQGWTYELIIVDDDSTDGTWDVIRSLTTADRSVRGLRLAARAGVLEAFAVATTVAVGTIIAVLEGDLETPPEDLVPIVARVREGVEFVSGVRRGADDRALHRRLGTRLLRAMTRAAPHQPTDFGCGTKAMRAELPQRARLDPSVGTDVLFGLGILRNARSYDEVPVDRVDRSHESRFGPRMLVVTMGRYAATIFPSSVRAVRNGLVVASLASVGWCLRRRGLAAGLLAVGSVGATVAAAGVDRLGRPTHRPGTVARVVDRVGWS